MSQSDRCRSRGAGSGAGNFLVKSTEDFIKFNFKVPMHIFVAIFVCNSTHFFAHTYVQFLPAVTVNVKYTEKCNMQYPFMSREHHRKPITVDLFRATHSQSGEWRDVIVVQPTTLRSSLGRHETSTIITFLLYSPVPYKGAFSSSSFFKLNTVY